MESTVGENSPACTSNLSTKITHGPFSVHQAYNIIKVVKGVSVVNKKCITQIINPFRAIRLTPVPKQ